jgi:phospholipase/lecithinase/hemolysin
VPAYSAKVFYELIQKSLDPALQAARDDKIKSVSLRGMTSTPNISYTTRSLPTRNVLPMKKIIIVLLSLLFCTNIFAGDIKQFVILGDSLSDNGNLLNALKIVPKSPPYYKGRFSNGPNWADHVENHLYKKYFIETKNYSYGGATAILHSLIDDKFIAPITLEGELYQYLLQSMFTDKSDILYGIWMGANDYLYDRQPSLDKLTNDVVNTTTSTINTLIKNGAKNFVVFNLPDLAVTPYARNEKLTDRLHALSVMHNAKLADGIKQIQTAHPEVKVVYIDIYEIFKDVLGNPDKYNQQYGVHITDLTQPCWLKDWYGNDPEHEAALKASLQKSLTLNNIAALKNSDSSTIANNILHSPSLAQTYAVSTAYENGDKPCGNVDEHIFWDIIHPTAVVHKVLGEMVIKQLTDAGY